MNIQWQNRQELTRHNARRWDVQGNNPVRDYSSVEKRNNPTPPRMPSGMQPAGSNGVAFLRNAGNRVGYNCYRAVFPTGMKRKIKTKMESWRLKTLFSPYFPNKTTLVETWHAASLQPYYLIFLF